MGVLRVGGSLLRGLRVVDFVPKAASVARAVKERDLEGVDIIGDFGGFSGREFTGEAILKYSLEGGLPRVDGQRRIEVKLDFGMFLSSEPSD